MGNLGYSTEYMKSSAYAKKAIEEFLKGGVLGVSSEFDKKGDYPKLIELFDKYGKAVESLNNNPNDNNVFQEAIVMRKTILKLFREYHPGTTQWDTFIKFKTKYTDIEDKLDNLMNTTTSFGRKRRSSKKRSSFGRRRRSSLTRKSIRSPKKASPNKASGEKASGISLKSSAAGIEGIEGSIAKRLSFGRNRRWSTKYKRSINCKRSQKQYCTYGRKK